MTIAFVGGGNMAKAIIGGLIAHGQSPEDIVVVEIDPIRAEELRNEHNVQVLNSIEELNLNSIGTLVFAVKPQQLPAVAKKLPLLNKDIRVVSIAAGVTTQALSNWLNGYKNIVRAMPNTPALILEGISGLYAMPEVSQEDRAHAQSLLGAVGSVIWVKDEKQLNAVTAVSGSGPAYFFWLMESMKKTALELGLSEEVAQKLIIQTAIGSAKLAGQSSDTLQTLREKVTSKGGTTEAALTVLNQNQADHVVYLALCAACLRAQELGDLLSQSE